MTKQDTRALSIGMFDSGIGGLTVLQQLSKKLPQEHFIYFGDTARLPYGEKSRETILRYSIENTVFLMEKNIKAIVVSCNTASSVAIEKLQQIFNIPIIGVIDPGVEQVVQTTMTKRIAVLGTKGTINSGVYREKILNRLPDAIIHSIACPLFVPLVEEGFINHESAKLIVKEYLAPLRKEKVDTLLLGCTHYPLLKPLIQEVMGDDVKIVDSATCCAETVAKLLLKLNLEANHPKLPAYQFYVSDNPSKFGKLGGDILGRPLGTVELIHHFI